MDADFLKQVIFKNESSIEDTLEELDKYLSEMKAAYEQLFPVKSKIHILMPKAKAKIIYKVKKYSIRNGTTLLLYVSYDVNLRSVVKPIKVTKESIFTVYPEFYNNISLIDKV